jgi:hypothetical protein
MVRTLQDMLGWWRDRIVPPLPPFTEDSGAEKIRA